MQDLALADQFGNRALGIQNAFALDLGWVGSQNRRDVGGPKRIGDLVCSNASGS